MGLVGLERVHVKRNHLARIRTAFLDKGLVDKLTVVNRNKVRIKLHSNATGVMQGAVSGEYYFSIGSVEAFERKLDEASRN